MYFIRDFPKSEAFNAILVVTDRFAKVQNYIVAKTTYTAEDVTYSYINDIGKLYSLPREMISDWGP